MHAEPRIRRSPEWQWTATGWSRAHRLSLMIMLASLFVISFVDGTERGLTLAAFFTILCTIGLLFTRLFEASLTDFLRGLSPRDCVLFFLLHGVAMAVPGFMGYPQWTMAVASLIGFVTFTSIDKFGFGRIHAASLLLILLVCGSGPLPPFEPLTVFILFFLLSYRLEHLASRLARHGEGRGVPVMPAAMQTFVWLVLPWVALTVSFYWLTPQMAPHTRFLLFEPGAPTAATEISREISVGTLIRNLFILAGMMVLLVIVAWWFERRLGLRRGGRSSVVEDQITATTSTVRVKHSTPATPNPDMPKDARGRILARFKTLAETVAREGWARRRAETAQEFVARLSRELAVEAAVAPATGGGDEGLGPFHRACYSDLKVDDGDAEAFLQWASATEAEVHARATEQDRPHSESDAMS